MTIGIMQPYLFPYVGYWQLIDAVDCFVIYDDVNYIKQGYINRNSILVNGKPQVFTLELLGASSNKLINEIQVGKNSKKILKTIKQNYSKAPYFNDANQLIEDIFNQNEKNLAKFIGYSIEKVCDYLKLSTKLVYSSDIKKNTELKAQDKVIDICSLLSGDKYINAIGGKELYSREEFSQNGLDLFFLDTKEIKYHQFENEFVPFLSIIDIIMFNDVTEVQKIIKSYELI